MSIRISEEHLAAIYPKAEQARMSFIDYVTKACLDRQIFVIDGLEEVIRHHSQSVTFESILMGARYHAGSGLFVFWRHI